MSITIIPINEIQFQNDFEYVRWGGDVRNRFENISKAAYIHIGIPNINVALKRSYKHSISTFIQSDIGHDWSPYGKKGYYTENRHHCTPYIGNDDLYPGNRRR